MSDSTTAILYDIHGNLAALEAVLAEADRLGTAAYLLGGDYAAMGPWPRDTTELLETLPTVGRIRGNVERWLLEEPEVPPSAHALLAAGMAAARESLGATLVEALYGLPEQAELDELLVCHGSPLSDIQTFAPHAEDGEERMLDGVTNRRIVFGHSHQQFRRSGPDGTLLVNPGSVGAPLDGDRRAAWATYEDGEIHFRRTEYDVERAAAQMRTFGEWAEPIVYRLEHAADRPR